MNDREFQSRLKQVFTVLGQKTIYDIIQDDIHYQEDLEKESQAEEDFLKIRHSLTKEQKAIIEKYVLSRDAFNSEYSVIAYLAGLKDMFRILVYLKVIDNKEN